MWEETPRIEKVPFLILFAYRLPGFSTGIWYQGLSRSHPTIGPVYDASVTYFVGSS